MSSCVVPFPSAILFDMDGTLTLPTFDFPAVRRALGFPDEAPILEYMAIIPADRRQEAEGILRRFEDEVAEKAPLADGCLDLLHYILGRGAKLALITRNRRDSVSTFMKRHPLPIDVCITREDGPHKPDPSGLLRACELLDVKPEHSWMVGDGQYDVEAGLNAGMRTIWLKWGRTRSFPAEPWQELQDLRELHAMLKGL